MNQYSTGQRGFRIKVTDSVDRMKFLAAIVKSAYLGLFVDRGYGYILLPALDPIRTAINGDSADRQRLSEIVFHAKIKAFTELPGVPDRVTFEVLSLDGVPACVSMINLGNASGLKFVVLPPSTNMTGTWDGLARATKALRAQKTVRVQMAGSGTLTLRFNPTSSD